MREGSASLIGYRSNEHTAQSQTLHYMSKKKTHPCEELRTGRTCSLFTAYTVAMNSEDVKSRQDTRLTCPHSARGGFVLVKWPINHVGERRPLNHWQAPLRSQARTGQWNGRRRPSPTCLNTATWLHSPESTKIQYEVFLRPMYPLNLGR